VVAALSLAIAIFAHPYDGRTDSCWMGQDDLRYFYACGLRRVDPCSRGLETQLRDCLEGRRLSN
jgi:hypothetical protein